MNGTLISEISTEYNTILNNLVSISEDLSRKVAEYLINVKFSLMILKGGIRDYKEGKISTDIYKEIKDIRENLSAATRLLILSNKKLETVKKVKYNQTLKKDTSKVHIKNIISYMNLITSYIENVYENVINPEYDLLSEIANRNIKMINDKEIQNWLDKYLYSTHIGFKLTIAQKKHNKNIIEHIKVYKQNAENEEKVKNIISELKTPKYYDEKDNEVINIIYITPGMIISKDIFDENGRKIKNAYETITENDIALYKENGINHIYLKNPKFDNISTNDYKISVIDNDIEETHTICEHLKEYGFDVMEYNEPVRAFIHILKEQPDVLFLNICTSDSNSLRLLENLNTLKKQAKSSIIIISDIDNEEFIRKAVSLGATDVISKPINFKLLTKKLANVLVTNN